MTPSIQVSIDGGITFIDAPSGVIVHHKAIPLVVDGEDGHGEIHITHSTEGVITDVWGTRADPLDTHLGTESRDHDSIVDDLTDEDD